MKIKRLRVKWENIISTILLILGVYLMITHSQNNVFNIFGEVFLYIGFPLVLRVLTKEMIMGFQND